MVKLNESVFFFFNQWAGQSPFTDALIVFCADYLAYILVAVFLAALLFRNISRVEKITLFASAALAAIVSRGIIVETIRFFYQYPRPFVTLSDVHQLLPESGYSFPSGHAAFFFALSAVVYRHDKKLGATFFILSLIMGIARVMAGVHYPLDIVGGLVVGILAGVACDAVVRACRESFWKKP